MEVSCNNLVLATRNPNKFRELGDLLAPLDLPLHNLAEFPGVRPVVEDGQTLAENAAKKATLYARQLEAWVLADDTGLEVDALGGAPGVRSARYAGDQATMAQNREKLLAELQHVPPEQRAACFVCQLAVANPAGVIVAQGAGRCRGRLLDHAAAGPYGFGYDVLFELSEMPGKTLAELPPDETARLGHRGRAVRDLLSRWRPGVADDSGKDPFRLAHG